MMDTVDVKGIAIYKSYICMKIRVWIGSSVDNMSNFLKNGVLYFATHELLEVFFL